MAQTTASLAVAGVCIKDNKLLLLRRAVTISAGGFYCMPGGHVEPHEPIQTALVREMHEEVGITVNPADIQFLHALHCKKPSGKEYITFFFLITQWQGEPYNKEPERHDKLEWFSCDELPENIIDNPMPWYRAKQYYSEKGW